MSLGQFHEKWEPAQTGRRCEGVDSTLSSLRGGRLSFLSKFEARFEKNSLKMSAFVYHQNMVYLNCLGKFWRVIRSLTAILKILDSSIVLWVSPYFHSVFQ